MKKLLCSLSIAALCLRLSAQATPNPSHVSADAAWAFHADFKAMRETTLGHEFIKFLRTQQFAATENFLALNTDKFLEAIGSITAYDEKDGSGGVLIHGNDDLRKIAEGLLVQETLQKREGFVCTEVKDAPFPTYSVRAKHQSKDVKLDGELLLAFPPEPVIIIAESQPQIQLLRDVLSERKNSLAKTPDAVLAESMRNAGNAYLYVGTTTLPNEKTDGNSPQSRILRLSKSASLAIGENGPQTFARAHLLAGSEETAVKLLKVVEGLAAMLSLAESKDADISAFLNSVKVQKTNQTITTEISYPSARILSMFQTLLRRLGDTLQEKKDAKKKATEGATAANASAQSRVSLASVTLDPQNSPAPQRNPAALP
jgi:hypothetical protein